MVDSHGAQSAQSRACRPADLARLDPRGLVVLAVQFAGWPPEPLFAPLDISPRSGGDLFLSFFLADFSDKRPDRT